MTYADIIVDISHEKLDKSFQYLVPEKLKDEIQVGMVVSIPFGRGNHVRKGYVVGISDEPKVKGIQLKSVAGIENDQETTESRLIALAGWMKENYGSTMIQALKTVLPIQKKIKAQEKRWITLLISREDGEKLLEELSMTRFKARIRLLEALLQNENGKIETAWASKELGTTASVLRYFEEQGIASVESDEVYRNAVADAENIPHVAPAVLSISQQMAVNQILSEWEHPDPRPVLLHGVTGSGKTEVYMELIDKVIKEGGQAIVLIPEIALTYQTVRRFYGRFGDKVSVINSRLSLGERYDQFKRAKQGELQVMVGPRSALFTPFGKLRLIIIDEEHESAYQSEIVPRYQAAEVAARRAEMSGALVVLGSATPSVAVYQKAREGMIGLHRLTHRARTGSHLPDVKVVDLREEFRMKNKGILSQSLHEAMDACLKRGEQMMLFLNRRGYAGFVSCRSCGYVVKCRHCDVSMTVHHHTLLKCHYCGSEQPMPRVCPSCGSPYIAGFGVGTQKVEEFVQKEFPEARILRMDRDTTSGKDDMGRILQIFSEGGADILIGTQMIVKGHDFANVTLVGILAADLSLFAGDYQSSERTFQLLTQAAGRAGRGDRPGEVIIQTYQPEHYCIQTAAAQDYDSFYSQEIRFRQMLHYPPDRQMMVMLAEGEHDQQTGQAVQKLREIAGEADFEAVEFIGPSRAGIAKAKDLYRYTMYMKHQDIKELMRLRDFLEGYLKWSQQFSNIYFTFDIRES